MNQSQGELGEKLKEEALKSFLEGNPIYELGKQCGMKHTATALREFAERVKGYILTNMQIDDSYKVSGQKIEDYINRLLTEALSELHKPTEQEEA